MSKFAKYLGENNDFKSQNLKPTPLAIFWAVSPAKNKPYSVIFDNNKSNA